MSHPVIAAQLYTVREYIQTAAGLASSLRRVRDIGYTAVQISGLGPIPDAEVKAMVDDLGLTICNTHTAYETLWHDTDRIIEQHRVWNCKQGAVQVFARQVRVGSGALQDGTNEAGLCSETKRDETQRFADGFATARHIIDPYTPRISGVNGLNGPPAPEWVCVSQTGWPTIQWPR